MAHRASIAALALSLAGCGAAPVVVQDAGRLLDDGDLKGALAASTSSSGARDRIAVAVMKELDPILTLEPVPQKELSAATGLHTLRHMDRSWAFVRVRLSASRRDLGDITAQVALTDPENRGLQSLAFDEKQLAFATAESYPSDTVHSHLTTSDAPFLAHVLTFGLLTILTLREEKTYTPPTADQIKAAVPHALRLKAALDTCPKEGPPCAGLLVLRRPASDDQPLKMHVTVAVRGSDGGAVSLDRTLDLPPGKLEERLSQSVNGLHLGAAPGDAAAYGTSSLDKLVCQDTYISPSSPYSSCSKMALAPWPTDEISPIGLVVPPAPEKLGTPESSSAARPSWAQTDDYAPDVSPSLLTVKSPVPETAEGALITCKQTYLDVPGEDADHVFALVKIGKHRWRESGDQFSLPLLTIDAKTDMPVSFYDWDYLSGDDHLATVHLKRHGDLVSGSWGSEKHPERGYAEVQCRLFPRDAVEAAFAKMWLRTTDEFDGILESPVAVRPDSPDFGESKSGLGDVRGSLREGAGLVGWDDPRLQKLIARLDELDARFHKAVRTSVEHLPAGADGIVVLQKPDSPGLDYRSAKRVCGEDAQAVLSKQGRTFKSHYDAAWLEQACLVKVTVENKKPANSSTTSIDFDTSFTLLLEDGQVVSAGVLGKPDVAPGATLEATIFPKDTPPPASRKAAPWRLVTRGFREAAILPLADAP